MITEYTWRRLREGEKVWVYSSWMKFAFPGVVKVRDRKKYVHINFFGDAQAEWRPRDRRRLLREVYLAQPKGGDENVQNG